MKNRSFASWIFYVMALVLGVVFFYYLFELYQNVVNYQGGTPFSGGSWGFYDFSEGDFQILGSMRSVGLWLALLCVLGLFKTGGIKWRNGLSMAAVSGLSLSYVIWLVSAVFVFSYSAINMFESYTTGYFGQEASKDAVYFILFHGISIPLVLLLLIRYWYLAEKKQKRPEKKEGGWRLE